MNTGRIGRTICTWDRKLGRMSSRYLLLGLLLPLVNVEGIESMLRPCARASEMWDMLSGTSSSGIMTERRRVVKIRCLNGREWRFYCQFKPYLEDRRLPTVYCWYHPVISHPRTSSTSTCSVSVNDWNTRLFHSSVRWRKIIYGQFLMTRRLYRFNRIYTTTSHLIIPSTAISRVWVISDYTRAASDHPPWPDPR